ncbi:hypothetical protein HH310_19345 [Actinoplanes sp. TBRC 11911]|uniref:hypothetical protein n=1 Tax=Actinoplanes sp. TBRC 11911 TaxID=2729386 RepID=UPI00145D1684|nr:hypothetical protein [Actinoplanes sp. TBRC 11911]NMO53335.1 hypothetical protein [Actinoplanes sp. TBRC 11911]
MFAGQRPTVTRAEKLKPQAGLRFELPGVRLSKALPAIQVLVSGWPAAINQNLPDNTWKQSRNAEIGDV